MAATFADPGDQADSGPSVLLLLLVVIALGLILGYAGVRLRRRLEERREEVFWRQRDADWEAVARQIEMNRGLFDVSRPSAEPSAERLQKVDAK